MLLEEDLRLDITYGLRKMLASIPFQTNEKKTHLKITGVTRSESSFASITMVITL